MLILPEDRRSGEKIDRRLRMVRHLSVMNVLEFVQRSWKKN